MCSSALRPSNAAKTIIPNAEAEAVVVAKEDNRALAALATKLVEDVVECREVAVDISDPKGSHSRYAASTTGNDAGFGV